MAKRNLAIRRVETREERLIKFSKRKPGVLKKAKELGIMCDVDLALLMFSPTGKPSVFVSHNEELGSILEKMSSLSVQDREESRGSKTMKLLKKTYEKNPNAQVDPNFFSVDRNDVLKSQEDQLKELQAKLNEKTKLLRDFKNPDNVEDMAQIKLIEGYLVESLNKIKNKKGQLLQRQQMGCQISAQATQDLQTN